MKTSKLQATYRVICQTATKSAATVAVKVEDKQEIYILHAITADEYTVSKKGEKTYKVNTWDKTCTCDGRRNGYLCRHLRLVAKMISRGEIQ